MIRNRFNFRSVVATVICLAGTISTFAQEEVGVNINGIIWATRNVDAPGTFAKNSTDAGMFYQWNRLIGWSATHPMVNSNGGTSWDNSIPKGTKWESANCPCPNGWRVPTAQELHDLREPSIWTTQSGVNGRLFGTAPNQIFLPATGWIDGLGLYNVNTHGYYWSNMRYGYYSGNLEEEAAHTFTFSSGNVGVYWGWMPSGFTIRCVKESTSSINIISPENNRASVNIISSENNRTIVGFFNIRGQRLPREPNRGIYVVVFDNGSAEKRVLRIKVKGYK